MSLKLLIKKSKKLRQDTFNLFIKTGEAHLGGSFSMIEALIVIFFKILILLITIVEIVLNKIKLLMLS